MKTRQLKATYGDRIGCGIKKNLETDDDDKLLVYFKKNGAVVTYDDNLWHFMKARHKIYCRKKVFCKTSLVVFHQSITSSLYLERSNFLIR